MKTHERVFVAIFALVLIVVPAAIMLIALLNNSSSGQPSLRTSSIHKTPSTTEARLKAEALGFERQKALADRLASKTHTGISTSIKSENSNLSKVTDDELNPISEARKEITIREWSWNKKDGFGTIMKATFTIYNGSRWDIKDIKIRCDHEAASGTIIDSNTETIYEVFPSMQAKTFSLLRRF